MLRLYCIGVSVQIVILHNGGVKNARSAQECEGVGHHFNFANQFALAFERDIKRGSIQIDNENCDLLYNNLINLNK